MNIAFLSDQFYPRTSADSEQIVSSLSALGKIESVTLISAAYHFKKQVSTSELRDYYRKEVSFNLEFVRHLFPNIRGLEKLSFALSSVLRVRKGNYDLVYTRNIPILISTLIFTSLPVVFESYRPWPARNRLAKWFFSKMAVNQKFLGVVLHSEYAGRSFSEVGFNDDKLFLAHNAFDFGIYKMDLNREKIRRFYEISSDSFLVTYSGRVNKSKGVDRIFQLAKVFPNVDFLIVGSEGEGEIEKQARNIENIKVLGWLAKEEVFNILRASDVLYIPPTTKARDIAKNTVLPLKTFIYKASGIPIIAPDMEDLREVLTHGENAYLVTPDKIDEEISALRVLIEDEGLRFRIGGNAKKDMEELTWDNRAKRIQSFIKSRLED
jgi:glycosyltransferase involved in cell wall biosynthesis